MLRLVKGGQPERPNRPLTVKCLYDSGSRRVQFPSARTCRLESLKTRVEEAFTLSRWPFHFVYTDDDGEEYPIKTEADFTEAIWYFVSGDDDHSLRGSDGSGARLAYPARKITMRVEVVVEYDGPSLSDTSSISSRSMSGESSWSGVTRSSATRSGTGSFVSRDGTDTRAGGGSESWSVASRDQGVLTNAGLNTSYSASAAASSSSLGHRSYSHGFADPPVDAMATMRLSASPARLHIPSTPQPAPRRRSMLSPPSANGGSSHQLQLPFSSSFSPSTSPPLAVSPVSPISPSETAMPLRESAPPPPSSTLTQSELGSRWLREQSQLASRIPVRSVRRHDSDNESQSDDEDRSDLRGEIALVEERGRLYCVYPSTDTSSLWSRSDGTSSTSRGRPLSRLSETSGATASPPPTPGLHDGPHGPPVLAPDCSACGIRLDYMRYVCTTCGEGDMWTVNAGKAPFVPRIAGAHGSDSDGMAGRFAARAASTSSGSDGQTVHNGLGRADSDAASNGSAQSPDELQPVEVEEPDGFETAPRGYELCATCIEAYGIAHAKAGAGAEGERRTGYIRHAFREKIWGSDGWVDVDYSGDAECTICHGAMFRSRYKCVSCPKFDLCRSCYQKVQEIHPAHVFLSLPDKPVALLPPPRPNGAAESAPVRHPGAFCHNCLQDIVGPRFHCAVCPSWDLCIQCEGIGATGHGAHTPDHIMMKIPVPLASSEVEVVSRRARDRWFMQNSLPAAATPSSRSSSPTIETETVYAPPQRGSVRSGPSPALSVRPNQGRTTPRAAPVITIRDGLDHNARCANCNEWIRGKRFQCANCPSDPVPYNLCWFCELRSYRVHDPRHVFFKFERPVHIPLQSSRPLLPPLYRHRVGAVPPTAVVNPRDPTAYLKYVLHKETLCDIHSDQIRGIWLRCAHCPSFDICSEAEPMAEATHDPTHVFIVFKARVDMPHLRDLAKISNTGAEHPRPLLQRQVYIS